MGNEPPSSCSGGCLLCLQISKLLPGRPASSHICSFSTRSRGFSYLFLWRASPVAQGLRIRLQCRRCGRHGFDPWVGKMPWRRAWQPTPVSLPGESPWTEEPGGLQSTESQRVRHDWSDSAHTYMVFRTTDALMVFSVSHQPSGISWV